jgi:uroporphyrinogen decarboxylase
MFEPLDPHKGGFGRQLENLKIIKDTVGPDVPVLQTVYSPLFWARRLSRGFVAHYREDEAAISRGVSTITDSTVAFTKACINEAGADGFYYAMFCCEAAWMTEDEYKKWSIPHDKRILSAMREAPMVLCHIHGTKDIFFDTCKELECDALSWEDRTAGPSIPDARKKTQKSFIGGINIEKAVTATAEQVYNEGIDAIKQAGGRGLVLSPGCTFNVKTPVENMFALKRAVFDYAKKH